MNRKGILTRDWLFFIIISMNYFVASAEAQGVIGIIVYLFLIENFPFFKGSNISHWKKILNWTILIGAVLGCAFTMYNTLSLANFYRVLRSAV